MADMKVVYSKKATPHSCRCRGQAHRGLYRGQDEGLLRRVKNILEEAGSSIAKVVKTTVFITTMDNFAEMNSVYEQYFTHKPARSCVAVKELPKGVPVEIECIALS
ncbi:hypothetical protein LTR75_009443 [Friedmanniomyces endolithicus]|nr:hypothetical protein LTR75_009443 [Friedmanniomyces endolithicus]